MDGVDIDWEFPGFYREPDTAANPYDQGTPKADPSEKESFTLLLKVLRRALDRAGDEDKRYYQLSVAVSPVREKIDLTDPAGYAPAVDFINVMTYDMHGPWNQMTYHHSALYPNPCADDQQNTDQAIRYFISLGVKPSKLNIGTPFYSRGWRGIHEDFSNTFVGSWERLKCWALSKNEWGSTPGLYENAQGSARGIWDAGSTPDGTHPYFHLLELEGNDSYAKYFDHSAAATYLYSKERGELFRR
ncbi:MAG: hypothetical protein HC808_15250 [Candidatus Competibacteraceae bacterium]|nr:hypothetical protein [Candidatus Competibacteraceae bacterium]